jgi:large subunit ribosomal protein L19
MDKRVLDKVESKDMQNRPEVEVGDTVKLHMRISEGNKERIQIFEGIVIAMKGSGMSKTVTVRKISNGVGVERIVPVHAPTLEKIEITKRGNLRRSKLYYMRDRIGRMAMKIRGNEQVNIVADELEVPVEDSSEVVETAEAPEVDATAEEAKA